METPEARVWVMVGEEAKFTNWMLMVLGSVLTEVHVIGMAAETGKDDRDGGDVMEMARVEEARERSERMDALKNILKDWLGLIEDTWTKARDKSRELMFPAVKCVRQEC